MNPRTAAATVRVCIRVLALAGFLLSPAFAGQSGQTSAEHKCVTEADIQPQEGLGPRFKGRDARIFIHTIQGSVDASKFDAALVVLGGGVVVPFKNGCAVGRVFLGPLAYINATEMVALFNTNEALRESPDLDDGKVKALAEAGIPSAQFYVGLAYGEWGKQREAIQWFNRSAASNFAPAMLALGMALAGPDWFGDRQVHFVGEPYPTDEFTDQALSYYWLSRAAASEHEIASRWAAAYSGELMQRISPANRRKGRELILKGEAGSQVDTDQIASLVTGTYSSRVFTAPDAQSLQLVYREAERLAPPPGFFEPNMSQAEADRLIVEIQSKEKLYRQRIAELESSGQLLQVPAGTVVRTLRIEGGFTEVEILAGRHKAKIVYVKSRDVVR